MKLALGTVQFGMNYGIQTNGQPKIKQSIEILNKAYAAGICCFDTASAYGTAEKVLGEFLRQPQIEAEKLSVISKFNLNIEELESCINQSLCRLGIDCLDGYMFHDANNIFDPAAVSALEGLKIKGLTRKIGVSIYTPIQAMKALEYDAIDIIQVPYNVFDRRLDKCGFFKKAKEQGVIVYARSSLLQGLLAMKPEEIPEYMSFSLPYLRKFQNDCLESGLKPFEAAVQYVLQHEYIDYIVFGVDNIAHLEEYITLSSKTMPVNARQLFKDSFTEVEDKLVMPNLWNS